MSPDQVGEAVVVLLTRDETKLVLDGLAYYANGLAANGAYADDAGRLWNSLQAVAK